LIQNWFYILINNKINDSILVLFDDHSLEKITSIFKNKHNIHIYSSESFTNYSLINNSKGNKILIIDTLLNNILNLTNITTKLLLVPPLSNFYTNQNHYIDSLVFKEISIDINEDYLYWLKKDIPLDLINSSNINLLDFINKKVWFMKFILGDSFSITKDITINLQTSLQTDIEMLREHRVLTSRLAIIIYRIATLDINANITKIGRYIHEKTGTKSKTFNTKMMQSLSVNNSIIISNDLWNKNFKAYNLNINETDIAIRTEIACNLLSYNLINLTIEMIAKSTKLPISTINKLYSELD